jgi:ActR/RegA family two-component response regulator
MMSGHGTTSTAVKSIKMGANDYLEKPLSYDRVIEAIKNALQERSSRMSTDPSAVLELGRTRVESAKDFRPAPLLPMVKEVDIPQRTLNKSTVIYGQRSN